MLESMGLVSAPLLALERSWAHLQGLNLEVRPALLVLIELAPLVLFSLS